uniref:RNA-dependent RNA polymerase n=1 Tax=Strongyloides papillosus TaxID=174720 RepID=A0A0N5C287_STREA
MAETCRSLYWLISEDKIGRDIMWLDDDHDLTIKFKWGLKNAFELPLLERVNMPKENYGCTKLEEQSRYYGETIINGNGIFFKIKSSIETYIPEESISLAQKMAEELMINHQSRRDQRSLLLECLSYMNHDSVKRIELPGYILKIFDCLRDSNIWVRDIFGGFPNLNEVVFWLQYHNRRHCGYSEDRNIMKRIIESLAEKENGTIIFSYMRSNKNTLCKSNT